MKRAVTLSITLALAALLALASSGCSRATAEPADALLGRWFDDATGSQYRFISDSLVVVPWETTAGGNALRYSRDGNQLDIVFGEAHRVSVVSTVGPEQLVLEDPITAEKQTLRRDPNQTTYAKQLAQGAVRAAREAGALIAEPDITWVVPAPEGEGTEWTSWSPSTLDRYAIAWDWTQVALEKRVPMQIANSGSGTGYSFTLRRTVPANEDMASALEGIRPEGSSEPTAGLGHFDVGYAQSKAEYPAGALLYLSGGLMYSLGNGYAIPVVPDPKSSGFVFRTHD